MSGVSRVSPVHTAMRNCTRDEGGPFVVGNQVLISSHRKLLSSKSDGGERCGNGGTRSRQATLREASAIKPLMTCRKALDDAKTEGLPFLRDQLGGCLRRPKRHPAWRRREAQPGFGMERENLSHRCKGRSHKRPKP